MAEALGVAASVLAVIGGAYQFIRVSRDLSTCLPDSDRQFRALQREVAHFQLLWHDVQPYLESDESFISSGLRQGLAELSEEIKDTLEELETLIRSLITRNENETNHEIQRRLSGRAVSLTGFQSLEQGNVRRIRAFWKRNEVKLRRSELQHTISFLNTVIAVVK